MVEKQKYDHRHIEEKWQRLWEDREVFKAEIDKKRPKYYILDMFPYPSGAGLHVGHVTGYAATDIIARYKRQMGFTVLHPMGWDSFGLPAEQYAIRTGTHPSITTEKNINTYRRQLKSLGLSYDWSREIATSDPRYYRWTQWIFTLLYEKGLAYEADLLVNYCPALGTVLANEEVENGRAKEGGHLIERRPLRQWILKITAYADRLIQDLELVDWPEHLKRLQVNWIGRSEGAMVDFYEENRKEKISVFTTCPHTLFGVTFLVLSPEHPLVDQIALPGNREAIRSYRQKISAKSDLERTDLAEEKTGVWTGAYAINPVNGEKVPIWIADYVLINYGTGAVMGVPAHDERDFGFAKRFDLKILPVIIPDFALCEEKVPEGLTKEDLIVEVLGGKRCWPYEGALTSSAHGDLSMNGQGISTAKQSIVQWLERKNLGKGTVQYRLRDWLFSRQRYWGEPFPILHFADGTKRALGLDELPLTPPELTDFKPTGSGESPLAKVREWVEVTDSKTGKPALRETNTMPQWAGSCWYYLRFCDPHNAEQPWDKEVEKYWMPVDLYVGGIEHAVLHLLYARFWHKVLYDCGYVSTPEPFQALRNQGLLTSRSYQHEDGSYVLPEEVKEVGGKFYQIGTELLLKSQIEKMSKSKLNGVTPDAMIEEYGADSLRLYEMFMGPFDKEKVWNTDAVSGCRRFLNRFYDLATSDKLTDEESEEGAKLGHRLVHAVQKDIESMQFNTAIAKMMEFLNDFTSLPLYPKSVVRQLTQVLYPFAPHIAEEVWERLGGNQGLTHHPFPVYDPKWLVDETALYVVQINGKVRGKWTLPKDQTEAELLSFIEKEPTLARYLQGKISKVVYVPNKLISLVSE